MCCIFRSRVSEKLSLLGPRESPLSIPRLVGYTTVSPGLLSEEGQCLPPGTWDKLLQRRVPGGEVFLWGQGAGEGPWKL
ncbi:unnamed protein product [Gadus morhua 'NCC']